MRNECPSEVLFLKSIELGSSRCPWYAAPASPLPLPHLPSPSLLSTLIFPRATLSSLGAQWYAFPPNKQDYKCRLNIVNMVPFVVYTSNTLTLKSLLWAVLKT